MCHLKPHSEKLEIRQESDISEAFAEVSKAVDKFHFPGHKKSDVYCQEKCNPKIELEKLGIEKVNSPACEQAFNWINKFTNLKSMNEPHFKFFLLYLVDLHNLNIQNNIVLANSLREVSTNVQRDIPTIQMENLNLRSKSNLQPEKSKINSKQTTAKNYVHVSDALSDKMENLNIDNQDSSNDNENEQIMDNKLICLNNSKRIEDCYVEDESRSMCCKFCPGKYIRLGQLKNHLESKHNMIIDLICTCNQIFKETTRYNRHKKNCK